MQRVYRLPKSSKRRYSVVSLEDRRSSCSLEDVVISPKACHLNLLQALDYFQQAEVANGRLAEFKAMESERKVKAKKGRSQSLQPKSALEKLRAATEKVMIVNTLRHPMAQMGYGKADLGKANDLKERLRRKSISQ